MAKEQAIRDDNNVPALLLHSVDGTETRKAKVGAGGGIVLEGAAAHDSPATGNPQIIGGVASSTAPSSVQNGDAVQAWMLQNGAQAVYNAYALDEDLDSTAAYTKEADSATITASGVVSATPVALVGYFVSASSSGVCTLYDNASAGSGQAHFLSGKTVATNEIFISPIPIKMQNGLYLAIGSGTATVRIYFRKLTAV